MWPKHAREKELFFATTSTFFGPFKGMLAEVTLTIIWFSSPYNSKILGSSNVKRANDCLIAHLPIPANQTATSVIRQSFRGELRKRGSNSPSPKAKLMSSKENALNESNWLIRKWASTWVGGQCASHRVPKLPRQEIVIPASYSQVKQNFK